jgi:putative transposase
MSRQCELIGISRSGLYYEPAPETPFNLMLMRLIDEQYLKTPFYGSRRFAVWLNGLGHSVNRKRVQRLLQTMGLEAIYPKQRASTPNEQHEKYPYLLRDFVISRPNQVWATDITYIPMRRGFLYLVAVVDWYSRYVLSWELSNSLDVSFCSQALEKALLIGKPEIFNSDQGCQFTSSDFTNVLKQAQIKISMDGKGRALDNIIVERLWRSVKYEEVYIRDYEEVVEAYSGIGNYLSFYNNERPHQSLNYRTPKEIYLGR